jgi:hypothetical protein
VGKYIQFQEGEAVALSDAAAVVGASDGGKLFAWVEGVQCVSVVLGEESLIGRFKRVFA